MTDDTFVRMTTAVQTDIYYHLERAAVGLRGAMDEAHTNREYERQAEFGHMLSHILLALAMLPGKVDDLPF